MSLLDITKFFPQWWYESRCFQQGDDIFFGTDDSASSLRKARTYCNECPVVAQCLGHALTQPEEYGIWAGTSARSREHMRLDIDAGLFTLEYVIRHVLNNDFKWRPHGRRRSGTG